MAYIKRAPTTTVSKRENVIAFWSLGYQQQEIARRLNVTHQTVSNIISNFLGQNTILPGKPGSKPRTVSTPEVVEFVEYIKDIKPSIFATEIQQSLIDHGVCTPNNVPSTSTIGDILNKDLNFTFKKLSPCPEESLTNQNRLRTVEYIMFMSEQDPSKVHFFDEASVTKTTPNRLYGHSKKGQPAVEVQRFSSNCNYTINLLHSRFGVDHFNILDGPSNGLEMLNFFDECLNLVDPVYQNPIFSNGDIVVMDNCGFHHGRFAGNELRRMFDLNGVQLVFQPPYSPDFNTCEFCFRTMKLHLRKYEQFAMNFTEVAIIEALQTITPGMSANFFQHCGFVI